MKFLSTQYLTDIIEHLVNGVVRQNRRFIKIDVMERRYLDYHTSAHTSTWVDVCCTLRHRPRAVVPLLITDKPITMLSDRRYLQTDCANGGPRRFPSRDLIWRPGYSPCRCVSATFNSTRNIAFAVLMSPLSGRKGREREREREMRLMLELYGYDLASLASMLAHLFLLSSLFPFSLSLSLSVILFLWCSIS